MPQGSEAASRREATYFSPQVSHLHFPSFKDRLSPCQSFGSCLEGCLNTAAPWGEAGRETDRLTDRQGLCCWWVSAEKKDRSKYTMFNSQTDFWSDVQKPAMKYDHLLLFILLVSASNGDLNAKISGRKCQLKGDGLKLKKSSCDTWQMAIISRMTGCHYCDREPLGWLPSW